MEAGAQKTIDEALALLQDETSVDDKVDALETLDEICETESERSYLVDSAALPLLFSLVQSENKHLKREATGILFRFGYRKEMTLDELLSKNAPTSAVFPPAVVEAARRGFDACFEQASYEHGKKLSMAEIDRKEMRVGVFAYGEAEFDSFMHVISHAKPQPGEVFYDLGSGLGKAVVAAFLLGNFSKVVGYELLEDLACSASELLEHFNTTVMPSLQLDKDTACMRLEQGDFLAADWSDADIVYANATRYDQELMQAITTKAEGLKPGARFVITTNPLISSDCFSLQRRGSSRVSWMGDIAQTYFVFVRN